MGRVTATEVKAILDNTVLTDPQIEAYITSANTMVNRVLGVMNVSDNTKEIERWLTAHMIASTRERLAKKEGAGGAFIEYAGTWGEGLKLTSYGQMVLLLDGSGAFAILGGGNLAYTFAIPD